MSDPTAEPIELRVTRWRCPFCTRSRSAKAATEAHIGRCWHNPTTRSCKTCAHYIPPEPGPYPEHPAWPEECAAGRDLTGFGPTAQWTDIKTNCPLWAASKEGDR